MKIQNITAQVFPAENDLNHLISCLGSVTSHSLKAGNTEKFSVYTPQYSESTSQDFDILE